MQVYGWVSHAGGPYHREVSRSTGPKLRATGGPFRCGGLGWFQRRLNALPRVDEGWEALSGGLLVPNLEFAGFSQLTDSPDEIPP